MNYRLEDLVEIDISGYSSLDGEVEEEGVANENDE